MRDKLQDAFMADIERSHLSIALTCAWTLKIAVSPTILVMFVGVLGWQVRYLSVPEGGKINLFVALLEGGKIWIGKFGLVEILVWKSGKSKLECSMYML